MLLLEEFAPITFAIGFLEMESAQCASALLSWRQSLFSGKATISTMEGSLRHVLPCLQPLTDLIRRELVFSTQSLWSAYFNNRIKGGDIAPVIGHLCQVLQCRGLAVTSHPDTQEFYGGIKFELFAPQPREFLNYERSITCINDAGKWEFETLGNEQEFEDLQLYKRRKIKDRFDELALIRYCHSLGIDIEDPSFYSQPAFLIEVQEPLPPGFREIPLALARNHLGL